VPVLRPISPRALRAAAERAGYVVAAEDSYNTAMVNLNRPNDPPLIVPKRGDRLAVGVLDNIVHGTDSRLAEEIMDEVTSASLTA
jgi:hypothetical protein